MYGSLGNGSAMRVSSVGWMFETLERTREVARWSAEVTHNHPEGIKEAECVAAVIWLARNGTPKEQIKEYVIKEFGYDLGRTCDTLTDIAAAMAEAYYGCPKELTSKCMEYTTGDMHKVMVEFDLKKIERTFVLPVK